MRKINNMLLYIVILLSIVGTANAVPAEQWNKTFGGSGFDVGNSVRQTADGGYIIVGTTFSYGAGISDVYLIKTDALGNKQWEKTFGGSGADKGNSVRQTKDGGYIITGSKTHSGNDDVYLIKTDALGNKQWEKTFGGNGADGGNSVRQTKDGGYIIVGYTCSGSCYVYMIKTDALGNKQWEKNFGNGLDFGDFGASVQQTTDGGYIIVSSVDIFIPPYGDEMHSYIHLTRTDVSGNRLWERTFGEPDAITGYENAVQQTTDGGYIIVGLKRTNTGSNVYLIKTYASGNKQWEKTFGGSGDNIGYSVQQTTDGGYIIVGQKHTNTDDSVYLIKTDALGNKQWEKTFGGRGDNEGYSVQQTSDGGYIIVGTTTYYGAGHEDVYLIKVSDKSVDLLKNPGFEESYNSLPRYWNKYQTGTMAIFTYPETGRIGGKSVAIRYPTKEMGKVALWQQSGIIVVPSKQYKLSGYMKLQNVIGGGSFPRYNGASLRINWYKSDGALIKADLITRSGTGTWTKYENTFTSPSNAIRATVGGDLFNTSGKVTFDDIEFVKIS